MSFANADDAEDEDMLLWKSNYTSTKEWARIESNRKQRGAIQRAAKEAKIQRKLHRRLARECRAEIHKLGTLLPYNECEPSAPAASPLPYNHCEASSSPPPPYNDCESGHQNIQGQSGNLSAECFLYYFDASTVAAAEPDAGSVRLNNADVSLVTAMYIDDVASNTSNISSFISSIVSNPTGNAIPGMIKISRRNDSSAFVIWNIDADSVGPGGPAGVFVDGTHYEITLIYSSSSTPAPFVDNEELTICLVRTGDRGGNTGPNTHMAGLPYNDYEWEPQPPPPPPYYDDDREPSAHRCKSL